MSSRKVVMYKTTEDGYLNAYCDDGLIFQWSTVVEEWTPVLVKAPIPQFEVSQPFFVLEHNTESVFIQTWTGAGLKITPMADGALRLESNTDFSVPQIREYDGAREWLTVPMVQMKGR